MNSRPKAEGNMLQQVFVFAAFDGRCMAYNPTTTTNPNAPPGSITTTHIVHYRVSTPQPLLPCKPNRPDCHYWLAFPHNMHRLQWYPAALQP